MEKPLVIRADASTEIGTGHLMRCLALGQAWKDSGGQVIFITACSNEQLLQRLYNEGFTVHLLERPYPDLQDWETTKQVLDEHRGGWLVLDGYHFDSEYQRKVKEAGHRLLVIDDMGHLPHYYADIVLNQNLHADQLHYSCEPYTKLLLGTRYVLLRREFLQWQGWKREIPDIARKVLVTLGGADPDNATLKVIRALQEVDIDGLEAVVVIGASNPYTKVLQGTVEQSKIPIRLIRDAQDMPELMAWADVAVSSGGSTCWELAFMGLPTIVGQIAEVENMLINGLKRGGLFLQIGEFAQLSRESLAEAMDNCARNKSWRERMSRLGGQIVDGYGSAYVLNALNSS